MLTDQDKQLIRVAYEHVTSNFKGFKSRSQQREMIARVANTIADEEISLIEAPTGTGKTMSYLFGAIPIALQRDKRIIISTATASLQDQLATKDIVLAIGSMEAVGMGQIPYVVAKGRERHVCVTKLREITEQAELFDANENAVEIGAIGRLWSSGTWDGIRDSLPNGVHPVAWMKISNTSATCVGEQCADVDDCPYYCTMKKLEKARVVITNHDYLLSNLANVPKSILCDTSNNVYIFDEAHHLSDKCLSAFSKTFNLLEDRRQDLMQIVSMMKQPTMQMDIALERCQAMQKVVTKNAMVMLGDASQHRFILGEVPAPFLTLLSDFRGSLVNVRDVLDSLVTSFGESKGEGKKASPLMQMVLMLANGAKGDINNDIGCLEFFFDEAADRARWIHRSKNSLELKCSPFDSSALAKQFLWSRIKTAVLTSATLQSLGSFASCLRTIGLPKTTPVLSLTSPLSYTNAQLIVPKLSLEAVQTGHSDMIHAFIRQEGIRSSELGVLVYFTSRLVMNSVYQRLSAEEKSCVLLQGQLQPTLMIKEHCDRVDAGIKSVLFGLDSLSEGIDLPGAYCTRVIITRLPFPNPDDPVLATHAEVMKKKGLEPFPLLMLPRAGTKFSQIVGRLIRKEGDYGIVYVLDQRLTSKQYGNQLLRGTSFNCIDRVARLESSCVLH